MPIYGIERTVRKVYDVLYADLDSYLTVMEAEWAATFPITLNRPAADAWYFAPKTRLTSYPSIVILGGPVRHGDQTATYEWQTANEGGGHDIKVVVVDCDDDTERLRFKLYRYNTVITRIIGTKYDLNQQVMFVQVKRDADVSPLSGGSGSPFVQAVRLQLLVQVEESIT